MDGKRSRSLTSAEIIAGNDDLLTETILLRLPARLLIRFQLVCKHWRSIISSTPFARAHTRLTRRRDSGFIFSGRSPSLFSSYFSLNDRKTHLIRFESRCTRIVHSCNGLLLLESRSSEHARKKSYAVHNPTTKQSRVVKLPRRDYDPARVCLAFDPSVSHHYKLVCVYSHSACEVYDSESGEWTTIGSGSFPDASRNLIYQSNKIFLIDRRSEHFNYLDLQTGKFGRGDVVKAPTRKGGLRNRRSVVEWNGRVHCVDISVGVWKGSMVVFELSGDYSAGWFEVYRVDLRAVGAAFPDMYIDARVLGIVRGETEQESSYALISVRNKMVILYRFCDGSFDVVLDLTMVKPSGCDVFQLVETLAPV